MIIVGELINASRKPIVAAIEGRDEAVIRQVAQNQAKAGANYIDVNAGTFVGREAEYLKWLTLTVQQAVDTPCALDSPDPAALEAALAVHKGVAMINSISLEKERYEKLLPVVAGTDLKVVALCMSDEGMPKTVEDRLRIAERLVNELIRNRVPVIGRRATQNRGGHDGLERVIRGPVPAAVREGRHHHPRGRPRHS